VAAVTALLILASLTWLPRLTGPLDLRWDGGAYYVLGTSLAQGQGYRLLNEPGAIEAVQYPPLFPAFIATHQWIAGMSAPSVVGPLLRASFFMITLIYVAASFTALRRYLSVGPAFMATVFTVLHVLTIHMSDICYAELPFACASALFFVFHGRAAGTRLEAVAGGCATAAYLLRTIGIALLCAWVAERLFERDVRGAVIRACFAALPVVAWHGYVASVERGATYQTPAYAYQRADYMFYNVPYARNVFLRDPFAPEHGGVSLADLARRFGRNILELPASLGHAVSTTKEAWRALERKVSALPGIGGLAGSAARAAPILLSALVLLGLIGILRRGGITVVLTVTFYGFALSLTAWPEQFGRYWAPLTPLICLAMVYALVVASRYAEREHRLLRWRRLTLMAIPIGIVMVQVTILVLTYTRNHQAATYQEAAGRHATYRLFFYASEYRALDRGLDWLTTHAQRGDIVAASMPHWTYLRTGLQSVMPPLERDPERAQRLLDSVPARYIVMDTTVVNVARPYMEELLRWAHGRWKRVYEVPSGEVIIYERVCEPNEGRSEVSAGCASSAR
jgi:hypothetical protein